MEVKSGASYTPYYYHADGLGSITGLSDATGTMVQTYSYDAFGNVTVSGSRNVAQPFAFTGREYDTETQMYFYRARYYDPQAGRFVTKDPIGFGSGDVNLYAYVENSPVNLIDPDGLDSAEGSRGGFGPISWGIPVIKLSPKQWQDFTEFFSRPRENIKNWIDSITDTSRPDDVEGDRCGKDKYVCEGYCNFDIIGTPKHVIRGNWVIAYGITEKLARDAWVKICQNCAPRGTTARHIKPRCYRFK